MIAKRLRKAIISKAIQGKLTEQLIEDGNFKDFSRKFRIERKSIINEGLAKKDNKYPLISENDIPFDIPENWEWIRLNEILTTGFIHDGDWVESKDQDDSGSVRLLQLADVGDGEFKDKSKKYMNFQKSEKLKCTYLIENDILIARMGSPLGRACIFPGGSEKKYVTAVDVCIIRNENTYIDNMYLLTVINSEFFRKQIQSYVKGTTRQRIATGNLKSFLIPMPPLREQKRIVEKLDEVLPLIDSLEKDEIKLNELMQKFPKNMKNSILQAAIQGKITEQSIDSDNVNKYYKEEMKINIAEYPFDIPENWSFVKMKYLISIQTGKKDANFGTSNGEFDFFTCALEPIKSSSYSYEGESILLPGNGANVGVAIYYNGKFEAYQRTYILQKIDHKISLKYLHFHLMANWKSFNKNKQLGSAIPYIKMGNLTEYPVAVPPLEEQLRIVEKLNEILPIVSRLNNV